MKKLSIVCFSLIVGVFMGSAPLHAQRGQGGGAGGGGGRGGGVGNAGGANSGEQGRANTPSTSNPSGKSDKSDKSQPNTNGNAKATDKSATVADRIESNPKLATKLQGMLPTGMSLQQASAGFKNEGQFIAALHVSKNLNIPFDALKNKMTGPNAESLGKAIHDLRPDLDAGKANDEAKKAEKEAKEDEKAPKATE